MDSDSADPFAKEEGTRLKYEVHKANSLIQTLEMVTVVNNQAHKQAGFMQKSNPSITGISKTGGKVTEKTSKNTRVTKTI